MTHTFRFSATNSGGYSVTSDTLLNLYLVATAATTTARLFQAVKLKRVQVWAQPPALGSAAVSVSLDWDSGTGVAAFGGSWTVSDTTSGIEPAYIDSRPPRQSVAAFWINNGQTTATLFTFSVPTGAIIDLQVSCVLIDTETPTAGQTTTGATVGRVYGCYLTSANNAPVGLTVLP